MQIRASWCSPWPWSMASSHRSQTWRRGYIISLHGRSQAEYLLGSRVASGPGVCSSDPLCFQPVPAAAFVRFSSFTVRQQHGLMGCLTASLEKLPLGWSGPTQTRADGLTHSHVAPLTLCAVLCGWVMSHCSLLSLMWRAVGRSVWPHSATLLLQSGSDLTPLPSHSYAISLLLTY